MNVDVFGILLDSIYALAAVFFGIGLVLTATSGRTRPVKVFLWILTGGFALLIGIGFVFTPLVIFLLFQVLALILFWYLCIIAGAACGWGIYALRHKRRIGQSLTRQELDDFVPLNEFCAREGIDAERARARISSGYYRGGSFGGEWYVHRSEQSRQQAP